MKLKPYAQSAEALATEYKTSLTEGLSQQEAEARLQKYGPNSLPEAKAPSWIQLFLSQFTSPLVYILAFSAVLVFFLGDVLDAAIIGSVLLFNALVGTIQEGRAATLLLSLKKFISSTCTVVREGKKHIIPTKELVPGDIIIVQEGERVPVDARIIASSDLKIDESMLTGESNPVEKQLNTLEGPRALYEQTNMLFSGTYVLTGNASAIVVATGLDTVLGQLQKSIERVDTRTPLRKQIERLSRLLLIGLLVLCTSLFIIGISMGRNILEVLLLLVALGVSVIPEGLPIVVTLVLAAGAYRMAQKHVLVKRLQAVEGLGRAQLLVVDKTGTLTRNEMMVLKVSTPGYVYDVTGTGYFEEGAVLFNGSSVPETAEHKDLFLARDAAALLSNAEIRYDLQTKLFKIKGDPLEAGMDIFARKLGGYKRELSNRYQLLYEIPFDATLRMHVAAYKADEKVLVFVSGAPEAIIQASHAVSQEVLDALDAFLNQGLRVIGLAYKELSSNEIQEDFRTFFLEKLRGTLNFLALLGIQDAIRPDAKEMVSVARKLGLEVIMATGDHAKTALFVAHEIGLLKPDDEVLTGKEFEQLSDKQLLKNIERIRVYARFLPHDKMRLIELFHKKDKLVAMTGDGVNDVPSLVAADLGIAMGIKGTEVAQQAADMVLLDDSFGSIIKAIEEGRHIFYTLRRVILYLFTTNLGEILTISSAFLLSMPFPLLPAQILWLNLVTDGFLDIALGTEKSERSALRRMQKGNLIDRGMVIKMSYGALIMACGTLLLFSFYVTHYSLEKARTVALVTMAAFQWFNAWNCRSEILSLFTIPLLSNKWLVGATMLVILLQVAALYVPFLEHILKTVPLDGYDWLLSLAVASSIILLEEMRKYFVRKRRHESN